jgi:hypothetical protein
MYIKLPGTLIVHRGTLQIGIPCIQIALKHSSFVHQPFLKRFKKTALLH